MESKNYAPPCWIGKQAYGGLTRLAAFTFFAALIAPTYASERFEIKGKLNPQAVSVVGRFMLDLTLRYAPEVKSSDSRFVLTAINVQSGGCNSLPDPIFSNGFEQ